MERVFEVVSRDEIFDRTGNQFLPLNTIFQLAAQIDQIPHHAAQLLMIPAYPFWSLSIFAVDILAIYGLVAYGSRIQSARF